MKTILNIISAAFGYSVAFTFFYLGLCLSREQWIPLSASFIFFAVVACLIMGAMSYKWIFHKEYED